MFRQHSIDGMDWYCSCRQHQIARMHKAKDLEICNMMQRDFVYMQLGLDERVTDMGIVESTVLQIVGIAVLSYIMNGQAVTLLKIAVVIMPLLKIVMDELDIECQLMLMEYPVDSIRMEPDHFDWIVELIGMLEHMDANAMETIEQYFQCAKFLYSPQID